LPGAPYSRGCRRVEIVGASAAPGAGSRYIFPNPPHGTWRRRIDGISGKVSDIAVANGATLYYEKRNLYAEGLHRAGIPQ